MVISVSVVERGSYGSLLEAEEAGPNALVAGLHFRRGMGPRRGLLEALLVEARDGVARLVWAEDVDRPVGAVGGLRRL